MKKQETKKKEHINPIQASKKTLNLIDLCHQSSEIERQQKKGPQISKEQKLEKDDNQTDKNKGKGLVKDEQLKKRQQEKKQKKIKSGRYYSFREDFGYLLKKYNYKVVKQIGRGGYGVVYKAHNVISDQQNMNPQIQKSIQHMYSNNPIFNQLSAPYQCVIKINFGTVCRQVVFSEIAYLELIKQNKFTRLPLITDAFIHEDTPHIVMKYYKSVPFISFFHQFKMADIKHYLLEMLIGLQELKNLGVSHRDVKPGNFLYNVEAKRGILIDLGIAQVKSDFMDKFDEKIKQMKKKLRILKNKIKNLQQNEQKSKLQEEIKSENIRFQKLNNFHKIYQRIQQAQAVLANNRIGTQIYMPLQTLLRHHNQSYETDIWAVGVIFLQFLTRKYNLFVMVLNQSDIDYMNTGGLKNSYIVDYILKLQALFGTQKIVQLCSKLGYKLQTPKKQNNNTPKFQDIVSVDKFDQHAEDLLSRMLELFQEKRIKVNEAIWHPFFDDVRDEHKNIPLNKYFFEAL